MAKNKATWLCEQAKQRTWKRQGESIKSKIRYKRYKIWELSIKTNVLMYNNEWFKIQSTKRGSYDPD